MAEALGVASSAVQLDDGILKLKYFWNAVKDAPEEMLYILDELDTTHLLLKEIEDSLGSQTMSPAAARSLRLCQKGMDTLNNTVKELGKEMQKRKKWSGVKVVMRKELLEKMKKRLEKANSLMTMAHQYYIASLSKSTYNEQVRLAMLQFSEFVGIRNALHSLTSAGSTCMAQQQTAEANTSSSSDTLTGKDAISISVARKALPGHQKILHAKLRLPFFSGVWGLCGYRQSISGWKFTPKTYNVVGYRAPIMVAASSGDVAKMQELFQTHRASPFDVDPKGHTLLHKAAMSDHSYQSCQLLVDQGADPNAQNRSSSFAWRGCCSLFEGQEAIFDTLHYLVSRTDCDIVYELTKFPMALRTFSSEIFQWLLYSGEDPIHERSHRDRAMLMLLVAQYMGRHCRIIRRDIKTFLLLPLAGMDMESCFRNMNQSEYSQLLEDILFVFISHFLGALKMRGKVANIDVNGILEITSDNEDLDVRDEQCLRDIHDLIDDIIFSGSKVYYFGATFEGFPRSFLDQLISGITFYIHQGRADPIYPKEFYVFFEPNIRYIFGMWLDKLVSAGVDLIRYGQWEEKHCHEVHYCTSVYGADYYRRGDCRVDKYWRLLSFTYGSAKSDWQFWFTEDVEYILNDELADFWDMVENPERQTPSDWNSDT